MKGAVLDRDTLDRGDLDFSALEATLDEWRMYGATTSDRLQERLDGPHVVVTNKVRLTADHLAAAPRLKLVCVAATGTDNVDLEAARAAGITVCNVPAYSTPAVVQHTFALLFALAGRVVDYHRAVRKGRWSSAPQFCLLDYPIAELAGTRLGIVGYGNLGRGVARAAECFGMEVAVAERRDRAPRPGRMPFDQVLSEVDVLSLHAPLTDETRGMIGAGELARMRAGALLINTARGGLVDERALADALRSGHLGGAGIDVLAQEPPPPDHPLLAAELANLIVTPHVAWASRASRQRLVDELAANVRDNLAGRARNVVT